MRLYQHLQSVLQDELGRCKHVSLDHKINNADLTQLNPQVYTDHSGFSYRLDGNNVDIDTENVELASEQLKYQALTSSIDSNFSRMKMVMK